MQLLTLSVLTAASVAAWDRSALQSEGFDVRTLLDGGAASAACAPQLDTVPIPAGALNAAMIAANATIAASLSASIPGYAFSVAYDGIELDSFAGGVANKATGAPMTPQTLTRVGSVTKVFSALMLFQLAVFGAVHVDDPVARYAPFKVHDRFYNNNGTDVQFRDLVSHTAGLQRDVPYGCCNNTLEALVATSQTQLIAPVGARVSYSNLGFALLGHVLAEFVASRVSGLPTDLATLVHNLITTPLAMHSTGFNYSPAVMAVLAQGYDAAGGPVPFSDLGWQAPAGGMYSTVQDLTRLTQALLTANAGGVSALNMNPAEVRRMLLRPAHLNPDGTFMGTPWEGYQANNVSVLTKGGNLPGYSAFIAMVPELRLSVAVAWNGNADEDTIMRPVVGSLVQALQSVLMPLQPVPNIGPAGYAVQYVGTYTILGSNTTFVVHPPYKQHMLMGYSIGGEVQFQFFIELVQRDTWIVKVPDILACLTGEIAAFEGQYIYFVRNSAGVVTSVTLPGILPSPPAIRTAD